MATRMGQLVAAESWLNTVCMPSKHLFSEIVLMLMDGLCISCWLILVEADACEVLKGRAAEAARPAWFRPRAYPTPWRCGWRLHPSAAATARHTAPGPAP